MRIITLISIFAYAFAAQAHQAGLSEFEHNLALQINDRCAEKAKLKLNSEIEDIYFRDMKTGKIIYKIKAENINCYEANQYLKVTSDSIPVKDE